MTHEEFLEAATGLLDEFLFFVGVTKNGGGGGRHGPGAKGVWGDVRTTADLLRKPAGPTSGPAPECCGLAPDQPRGEEA